ncbi:hypothetical protein ACUXG3_005129 [Bacillus thuringiensis]
MRKKRKILIILLLVALIGSVTICVLNSRQSPEIIAGDFLPDEKDAKKLDKKIAESKVDASNFTLSVYPEGDNKWIHVTLPTEVVFRSDEKNDHKTIVSPTNYTITNKSGRPVQVSLQEFKGVTEGKGLKNLNLESTVEGDFDKKELIKDKNNVVESSELVKLANNQGELTGNNKAKKEVSFKFTGDVDKAALTEKKENVEYKMTLKFKALKMDGSEVTE